MRWFNAFVSKLPPIGGKRETKGNENGNEEVLFRGSSFPSCPSHEAVLSWPTPGCGSRWPRRKPPSKVLGINYIFWSLFGNFFRLLLCLEDLAFSFWITFTCGATMRGMGHFLTRLSPKAPSSGKKRRWPSVRTEIFMFPFRR